MDDAGPLDEASIRDTQDKGLAAVGTRGLDDSIAAQEGHDAQRVPDTVPEVASPACGRNEGRGHPRKGVGHPQPGGITRLEHIDVRVRQGPVGAHDHRLGECQLHRDLAGGRDIRGLDGSLEHLQADPIQGVVHGSTSLNQFKAEPSDGLGQSPRYIPVMRWPSLEFRPSPGLYLALFGGLQVGLLWLVRDRFGLVIPLLAAALLVLMPALLRVTGQWRWKAVVLAVLIAITTVGPVLVSMETRSRLGITLEQDGLVQTEAAIDRLMHGQAIYGVDWSGTDLARYPLTPDGPNPALKHFAYLPLQVLVGVPVRALTGVAGVGFDYRIVLLVFLGLALAAVLALPISAASRFMIAVGLFLDPLVARFLWAGHNDICWLAMLLGGLALLARRRPVAASLAFGVALAFKPFAVLAIPFVVLALIVRWDGRILRNRREAALSAVALLAPSLLTIVPFLIINAAAFIDDTVLYSSGGTHGAYFISGYGFAGLLLAAGLIKHRTDYFPFLPFQAVAALAALWIAARRFLQRPTIGRWMAGYTLVLFGFLFFSRFLNDSYLGVVVALAATIPALRTEPLVDRRPTTVIPPIAA